MIELCRVKNLKLKLKLQQFTESMAFWNLFILIIEDMRSYFLLFEFTAIQHDKLECIERTEHTTT